MSEDRTQQQRQQQESPLQTERGGTNIENTVVQKIGGILSSVTGGNVGGGSQSRGVSVEVGEVESAIDVTLTVEYGKAIPQIAEAVRRNIINRVENLVGLNVTEVNVSVNDVFFPEQERQQEQEQQQRQLEQQRQAEQEQRVR